jgi:hypothetical protein
MSDEYTEITLTLTVEEGANLRKALHELNHQRMTGVKPSFRLAGKPFDPDVLLDVSKKVREAQKVAIRDAGRRRVDRLTASGEYSMEPLKPGEAPRENALTRAVAELREAEAKL